MKKILAMVLALAMVLSLAAATAETYTIGMIGPLLGGAAIYGNAVKNGAQIAVDEINAADNGITIVYLPEDDSHNAEISVAAYNSLKDNDVQMILGTVTTSPCLAVSAEAYNDRVFMLTPSASSAEVVEGKDNTFQVCFQDPAMGVMAAQYMCEHMGAEKKIGVIYNNADPYSDGIYQTFKATADELGMKIVAVTTVTDDTTDYSVQVAECKNADAEVVFLPMYYTPASRIMIEADKTGYAPTFFGVDGMDGILTVEGFDTSLAEGVMLLVPFYATATDDLTVNFVTKYEAAYGETPNQFAADGYDGIYALIAAAQIAGITSDMAFDEVCDPMISVFSSDDFSITGVTGTMSWNADGVVNKSPLVVVIQNGIYVKAD